MFVFGLNAPKPITASGPRPDTSTISDSNAIFMGLGAASRHDCSFRKMVVRLDRPQIPHSLPLASFGAFALRGSCRPTTYWPSHPAQIEIGFVWRVSRRRSCPEMSIICRLLLGGPV
jgi:hypothetical protein